MTALKEEEILSLSRETVSLVRAAFSGEGELPSDDRLSLIYRFAKRYDVAHLCAVGLRRLGKTDGAAYDPFAEAEVLALFRYERLRYEYERITALFRTAEIEYIPLKGTVMRAYYPEPYYRTSCDIDVLVRESMLDKAASVLSENGYTVGTRGPHDLSFHSESGVHFELHYCLTHSPADKDPVLARVFDVAIPVDERPFELSMPLPYFYYHHINHMMRHFSNGGGGIRPYLDLYLFLQKELLDRKETDALLAEGGALRFAAEAEALAALWFSDGQPTEITAMTERFLFLSGGMYSNMKKRTIVGQIKRGGKLGYLLSRLFAPYDEVAATYPSLRKHPRMFPLYQIRRWGRFLFCGGIRRARKEIDLNMSASDNDVSETARLLTALGIQ